MIVKIKVESLPLHFIVLGIVFILLSLFGFFTGAITVIDIILLIAGVLMVSSHQRLDLDLNKAVYFEYYWVMGFKAQNETGELNDIQNVYLSKAKYQQEYGKYNRWFIKGNIYKGYIGLAGEENLFVGQDKGHSKLMKKLEKIAARLKVSVEDRTD